MKRKLVVRSLLVMATVVCAYAQTYQTTFENARALLKQKRYTEALQEAERANSLDSSQWGAYFVAGTALVGLDRQANAIVEFQGALERAPEQAKPTINEAIAACRQILANHNPSAPAQNQPLQHAPTEAVRSYPTPTKQLHGHVWIGESLTTSGRRGASVQVTIPVTTDPGYFVNSNTPTAEHWIPLKLTWTSLGEFQGGQVTYPLPFLTKTNFATSPLSAISGSFDLVTYFSIPPNAPAGPGIAMGKLRFQACNSSACLPPQTVDVRVSYSIQ